MKVTIRDIAREAGVSPATVSNVFNGKNKTSEKNARTRSCHRPKGAVMLFPRGCPRRTARCAFIIFKRHGKVIMDTPFSRN